MHADEREYYDLADFYKIFSDSSRVKILFILLNGPYCVKHLSEKAGMSQSAVSHQLAVLRHTNIVKQSRAGQTITYSLADDHVAMLLELALAHLREEE